VPQDAQCRDYGGKGHEKAQGHPGLIGTGAERMIEVAADPRGSERDDQTAARPSGRPGQRPAARRPWPGRGRGRGSRDIGGERSQLGAGPRGQRTTRPRAELIPAQPALHERILQRLDHQLAVSVTRPEPVTARRRRILRSCHHRHPRSDSTGKRSAAAPPRPESLPAARRTCAAGLTGARPELGSWYVPECQRMRSRAPQRVPRQRAGSHDQHRGAALRRLHGAHARSHQLTL
jgi:hypothetical protein